MPTPAPTPTATATAEQDCVGAAALANGCEEPPTVAVDARSAPCERTEPLGLVEPCAFGPAGGETFALIGDSHANALRSAFAVAAEDVGWRGYALTRNGCPYVRDGRALPEPAFSQCATFKQQVPQWLAQHPEVTTVFVIGLPRNAASQDPANWLAAWQAFPASVKRLVVLRDTPELREDYPGLRRCCRGTTGLELRRGPCDGPRSRPGGGRRAAARRTFDRPVALLLR